MLDQQLAEEFHEPIIRKFKKHKVHLSFLSIWGADLADKQLINKLNKGIRFYCAFLIFSVNMHGLLRLFKKY